MIKLYQSLGEHAPADMLKDDYHGHSNKRKHILGGPWVQYTNSIGKVWMINNFVKRELEKPRTIYDQDQDGNVTKTNTYGKAVNADRMDEVSQGLNNGQFRMAVTNAPKNALKSWGLFPLITEDGL